MERTALTVCTVLMFAASQACTRSSAPPRQDTVSTDFQTIDTTPVKAAVLDPPPVLSDEGAAPKPTVSDPHAAKTSTAPAPAIPEDEAMRASLPFSPAIGLDPVNGMKISLKANTPFVEHKNHLYYFTSEDTKRTFLANPEQYTKGIFAH